MAVLAGSRHCPCVANGRLRHMLIGYARVSKADGSQSLDRVRAASPDLQYQSLPTTWLALFLISLGSRASISASEKVISSYC